MYYQTKIISIDIKIQVLLFTLACMSNFSCCLFATFSARTSSLFSYSFSKTNSSNKVTCLKKISKLFIMRPFLKTLFISSFASNSFKKKPHPKVCFTILNFLVPIPACLQYKHIRLIKKNADLTTTVKNLGHMTPNQHL